MAFSYFRFRVVLLVFFALLEGQRGSKPEGFIAKTSNNESDNHHMFSAPSVKPAIKASLTTVNGLVLLGALLGNILVIHIVRSNVRMRTTTNILIVNMAVSDLLIALLFITSQVIHLYIGYSWLGGNFGLMTCKMVMSSRLVSVACSVLSLVAIAIDRYHAVVRPLKRRTTSDKTKYIIVAIWTLSVSVCIPPMKSYKLITLDNGASFCIVVWATGFSKLYIVVGFVVTFIIPVLVMSTLYAIIGRNLYMRRVPGNPLEVFQAHALKTSRHVNKMMITVVISFALCMLPIQIYLLVRFFHPDSLTAEERFWGISLTALINNVNCFINPCIYATFNEKFRLGFRKALLCCSSKQDHTEQSHTSWDCKAVLQGQGSSNNQANNQAARGQDQKATGLENSFTNR